MDAIREMIKGKRIQQWIPEAAASKAHKFSNTTSLSLAQSHGMISMMSPTILDARIVKGKRHKKMVILGKWEFEI